MARYTILLQNPNFHRMERGKGPLYDVLHVDRPTMDTVQRADMVLFNGWDGKGPPIVVKNRWDGQVEHKIDYAPPKPPKFVPYPGGERLRYDGEISLGPAEFCSLGDPGPEKDLLSLLCTTADLIIQRRDVTWVSPTEAESSRCRYHLRKIIKGRIGPENIYSSRRELFIRKDGERSGCVQFVVATVAGTNLDHTNALVLYHPERMDPKVVAEAKLIPVPMNDAATGGVFPALILATEPPKKDAGDMTADELADAVAFSLQHGCAAPPFKTAPANAPKLPDIDTDGWRHVTVTRQVPKNYVSARTSFLDEFVKVADEMKKAGVGKPPSAVEKLGALVKALEEGQKNAKPGGPLHVRDIVLTVGDKKIPFNSLSGVTITPKAEEKCECGAYATGMVKRGAGHSSWCPWSKT